MPQAADTGFIWIPVSVAFPCVSLAVGVAIMRYRLHDIDRIISRTIGWGLLTGTIVAVFAIGVIALEAAFAGITQGQTVAVAVAAPSTLIAFALFQPLHRRLQRVVDRRFRWSGSTTHSGRPRRSRSG